MSQRAYFRRFRGQLDSIAKLLPYAGDSARDALGELSSNQSAPAQAREWARDVLASLGD